MNRYAHITYKYNYYSVPHSYIGQSVTVKCNGKIIRIYNESYEEIGVHEVSDLKGEFITDESHNPRIERIDYEARSFKIGDNVHKFYKSLEKQRPYHYRRMMQGIFNLVNRYGEEVVDLSCKRANEFRAFSYASVKKICEKGLYKEKDVSSNECVKAGGYSNDLSQYDLLV